MDLDHEFRTMQRAIEREDYLEINHLLNSTVPVNAEHNGFSPIMYAIIHNKRDLVDYFWKCGARICGLEMVNCCMVGGCDIYPYLLDRYIDVGEVNDNGEGIMHYLAELWSWRVDGDHSKNSVEESKVQRILIEPWIHETVRRGADMNLQSEYGHTPLHAAVVENSYRLVELYLELGAIPEIGDAHGETPLHYLWGEKAWNSMEPLLKFAVNRNPRDQSGDTPLHYALGHFFRMISPQCVRMMLSYGADPNIRNINNFDALAMVALREMPIVSRYQGKYSPEYVEELRINETRMRKQNKQLYFIRMLLDAGADPDALVGFEQKPMRTILFENKDGLYNQGVIEFFKNYKK